MILLSKSLLILPQTNTTVLDIEMILYNIISISNSVSLYIVFRVYI